MKLKNFIELYDDWDIPFKINDNKLNPIVIKKPWNLQEMPIWEEIKNCEVVSFGCYEFSEEENRTGKFLAIRIAKEPVIKKYVYEVFFDWQIYNGEERGNQSNIYESWEQALEHFNKYISQEKEDSWWTDMDIEENIKLDENGNWESKDGSYEITYRMCPQESAELTVVDNNHYHFTSIIINKKEIL